jgi:N-acetyl-anhydromuramyl-L-alanine amidase AmpD
MQIGEGTAGARDGLGREPGDDAETSIRVTVRRDFPQREGERFGAWCWSNGNGARLRSPQRWRGPEGALAPGGALTPTDDWPIFGWGIGTLAADSMGGGFTTNDRAPIAAEVQLVATDGHVISTARTSGVDGEAQLDTSGVEGRVDVRVIPDDRTDALAGPTMPLPDPCPDIVYRPGSVQLRLRAGLIAEVRDPYDPVLGDVTTRVGNRVAHEPETDHLPLTLKPVWWRHPGAADRDAAVVVDTIIVHCTSGARLGNALQSWFQGSSGAHYVIEIDGHVIKLADDRRRVASVAGGLDRWERQLHPINSNDRSVGIEIINPIGYGPNDVYENYMASDDPQPYNAEQYWTPLGTGVIPLLHALRGAFPEILHRIVGHSDVATGRHPANGTPPDLYADRRAWDPGERFDWRKVAAAGLGMSPAYHAVSVGVYDDVFGLAAALELRENDRDPGPGPAILGGEPRPSFVGGPIRSLQLDLRAIGYSIREAHGRFDEWTAGAIDRFRRHFEGVPGRRVSLVTAQYVRAVAMQARTSHARQGYVAP